MANQKLAVSTLGFPRIGRRRELKFALESYWAGKSSQAELLDVAAAIRKANWVDQLDRGVTNIPSNDFSLYDHVLDTAVMVGAVPDAYGWTGGEVSLDTYFAMARGSADGGACGCGGHGSATALEMTKWFDTNYHYMVPEFGADQVFKLSSRKLVDEFLEAKELGIHTRPVLVGPTTFLKLGKIRDGGGDPIDLLPRLVPVYAELLTGLKAAGADWVQIDEPILVTDLNEAEREAIAAAYRQLATASVPKIMLATYFAALGDNLDLVASLPIAGLHVDLVRAPEQLDAVAATVRKNLVLSLGVIDGRNIWRADLDVILDRVAALRADRGADGIEIAPSCSLIHVPLDLAAEPELDTEIVSWLSFAIQKIEELDTLAIALVDGRAKVDDALKAARAIRRGRAKSLKVNDASVQTRIESLDASMSKRESRFADRRSAQDRKLDLPQFPTTTIGSFPQTPEVRRARAAHGRGELSLSDYETLLRQETEAAIRWQEEIGLDVLVHGEFERNDMVQYFGERLSGFAFTKNAWVQSYGSRYVRPPIIFGDVARPEQMTVGWWQFAQSLTDKPVKGMLTGPVTILNWSFVRDDLARSQVCRQIALAIRDEVIDLERAGAAMIQIDEAALREGLPLRQSEWRAYLDWAVECFRLTAAGVADGTQIHTHMCYSEFNDIIEAIAAMDADVISIETSRSKMELLDAFRDYSYPAGIGPGVYDIHSPRVPEIGEMTALIDLAKRRLDAGQLWINPDCGLKTRKWDEVRPALVNMVAAARQLRARKDASRAA